MNGSSHSRIRLVVPRVAVLVAVMVALYVGWREFHFLTDDAFITFRYIDHFRRGWGYTWNPPPFQPVEGYSNFLWMVLLHGIWVVTGASPPAAANVCSLLLSYGSLALGFACVWRASLPSRWVPWRFALAAAVVCQAVVNRTFVTWTSSGLETALFGFCSMLWIFGALEVGRRRERAWLVVASVGAATAALTRPDGMLMVFGTGLLAAFLWCARKDARTLLGVAPLVVVPLHLLWRYSYYGAWVPNTYFAKHVSAWPDAGVRFTASFILEYAVWSWALVGVALLVARLWLIEREGLPRSSLFGKIPAATVAGVLVAHVAYYTLVVGGDHFEYRVYAHLVVPMAIALVHFVVNLPVPSWAAFCIVGLVTALGLPIPWVHYAKTRNINTRHDSFKMYVPVAKDFPPGPLRNYARSFDRLQKWMQPRHVGTRHQEHKMFFLEQVKDFPSRSVAQEIKWQGADLPVYDIKTVGIPGWVMPEIAVIDFHGLNDWVVARNPVSEPPAVRLMAHERFPPPGYIECFEPNVAIENAQAIVRPRKTPLTPERIRACEARFGR